MRRPVLELDRPGPVHGNLGYSYKLNQRWPPLASGCPRPCSWPDWSNLAVLIAVPLGLLQASPGPGRRLRGHRRGVHLYSMPRSGCRCCWSSCSHRGAAGSRPRRRKDRPEQVLADPAGMVLPVASLTLITVALFSRYMRSSAIDQPDPGLCAHRQAKGASEARLLRSHILRNSLLPGGHAARPHAAVHGQRGADRGERLQLPGHGPAVLQRRQIPGLPGPARQCDRAAWPRAGSLLADISYAVLDPRVRNSYP